MNQDAHGPANQLGPEHLDDPIVRHMRRDAVTLPAEFTIGQSLEALRSMPLAERILYLYVVDGSGRLVGVVPTRRLLMSQPDETIAAIMQARVVSIPAEASVLVACEFFVMHRYLAFPVVDEAGRMIGVVDVSLFAEEVLGLAERRQLDDVFQLIGVHVAQARRSSPMSNFALRFPWLLCNIAGGIGCAAIIGLFQSLMQAALVLALFVPVVLALAESVSIQSMTITLQSLHARRVNWRRFRWALAREFATAGLLGVISGGLVGAAAWLWLGQPIVALALAGSIWLSMVTACLLGVALPSAVHALRGDPKIAAGPITLAVCDLATLVFYLSLSGWMLS